MTSSNKVLNTENSLSDTSMNILTSERRDIKKSRKNSLWNFFCLAYNLIYLKWKVNVNFCTDFVKLLKIH